MKHRPRSITAPLSLILVGTLKTYGCNTGRALVDWLFGVHLAKYHHNEYLGAKEPIFAKARELRIVLTGIDSKVEKPYI